MSYPQFFVDLDAASLEFRTVSKGPVCCDLGCQTVPYLASLLTDMAHRQRLKDLMGLRGKTVAEVVAESGVAKSTIYRWRGGGVKNPNPREVISVALVLQVDPAELRKLIVDGDGAAATPSTAQSEPNPIADGSQDGQTTLEEMVGALTKRDGLGRRQALKGLAVLSGAPLLDPMERWLASVAVHHSHSGGRGLCRAEVERLAQTASVLRKLKGHEAMGFRATLALLDEVKVALGAHQSREIERRLYSVMATLAFAAASMSWDASMQRCAQDYYCLAVRSAHMADDPLFSANAMAALARQMFYLGKPHDALELVRLARYRIRDQDAPRLDAMLLTRVAWAYAAMGRFAAFERTTHEAREILARAGSDTEPQWIRYFDDGELAGVTGGRLLDLTRSDPATYGELARDELEQAVASRQDKSGRGYVLDRLGLAECSFLLRDVAEGLPLAEQALTAAEQVPSGRVLEKLKKIQPHLAAIGTDAGREAANRAQTLLEGVT